MRSRCDSCGVMAPDVVAPILFGHHGWREFGIDGTHEGRPWTASVLLCGGGGGWKLSERGDGCQQRMAAFIESGGIAGQGPPPPNIKTCHGGLRTEPDFAADKAAA